MVFVTMIFNLFKKKDTKTKKQEEAVIIQLDGVNLSEEVYKKYDLATLEDKINEVIKKQTIGEYDGHESKSGMTEIYLYASDSEKLFSAIKPILQSYPLCKNAKVVLRKGGPGSALREEVISRK